MMSNEKKKNWVQFDGKKVPLENRETLEDAFNKQQDRLVEKIKNHRKDLSKQIYQYIVKNPDVKAKVIANHFNVSRKFINHFLYKKTEYGLKDFVQKNQFDQWRIKDE